MTREEKRQALNRVPQRLDVTLEYERDDGSRSWTSGWRLTGRVRLDLVAILKRDIVLDSVTFIADPSAWQAHTVEVTEARGEARRSNGRVYRGKCLRSPRTKRSRFRG